MTRYFLQKPPIDAVFRHAVSTQPQRLAVLTDRARRVLAARPDGLCLPALAAAISSSETEARDAVQELGKAVALYWPGRGWRIRLCSAGERRLIAANDDRSSRVWVA